MQTKAVPLAYLLNRIDHCYSVGTPESPSLDLDDLETAFESAGTVHMGFGFIRGCGLQDFQHSTTAKMNLYSLWSAALPSVTPTILREETLQVKDQLNSDGCNGFTFGITDQQAFTSLMGRTDPALGVVPLKINSIQLLKKDGKTLTDPHKDVMLYLCKHDTVSLEKTFIFTEKQWHVGEHDGCERLLCYIDAQPFGIDPMTETYAKLVGKWVSLGVHAVARADISRKLTVVDFCEAQAFQSHGPGKVHSRFQLRLKAEPQGAQFRNLPMKLPIPTGNPQNRKELAVCEIGYANTDERHRCHPLSPASVPSCKQHSLPTCPAQLFRSNSWNGERWRATGSQKSRWVRTGNDGPDMDVRAREGRLVCAARQTEPTAKEVEGCYVLCRGGCWLHRQCRAFFRFRLDSSSTAPSVPHRSTRSCDGGRKAAPHQLDPRTATSSGSRLGSSLTVYLPAMLENISDSAAVKVGEPLPYPSSVALSRYVIFLWTPLGILCLRAIFVWVCYVHSKGRDMCKRFVFVRPCVKRQAGTISAGAKRTCCQAEWQSRRAAMERNQMREITTI
eukprot:2785637-Prymnesium_polylepis.1